MYDCLISNGRKPLLLWQFKSETYVASYTIEFSRIMPSVKFIVGNRSLCLRLSENHSDHIASRNVHAGMLRKRQAASGLAAWETR
jgi:hypothetical protein